VAETAARGPETGPETREPAVLTFAGWLD